MISLSHDTTSISSPVICTNGSRYITILPDNLAGQEPLFKNVLHNMFCGAFCHFFFLILLHRLPYGISVCRHMVCSCTNSAIISIHWNLEEIFSTDYAPSFIKMSILLEKNGPGRSCGSWNGPFRAKLICYFLFPHKVYSLNVHYYSEVNFN